MLDLLKAALEPRVFGLLIVRLIPGLSLVAIFRLVVVPAAVANSWVGRVAQLQGAAEIWVLGLIAIVLSLLLDLFWEDLNTALKIGPRFGNSLTAMENYGFESFGLDSQLFWDELYGLAAPSLSNQYEKARATVDFLVGLFTMTTLFMVIVVAIVFWPSLLRPRRLLDMYLALLVAGTLWLLWYRGAVKAWEAWAGSLRALVNVGRLRLAEAFALELPGTFEEERVMWENFAGYVATRDQAYLTFLNVNRRK